MGEMPCGKIHVIRQFANGKVSPVVAMHDADSGLNAAVRRFSDITHSQLWPEGVMT